MTDLLLLESGDALLVESGDALLVEGEYAEPASPEPSLTRATWTFWLRGPTGVTLAPVDNATDRTLSFRRNNYPTCNLAVDTTDEAFRLLYHELRNNGLPQLVAVRDVGGVRQIGFAGWLSGIQVDGDANEARAALTFAGPFAQLDHRYTSDLRAFDGEDAGTIAKTLIDEADAVADVGITTDEVNIEATVERTIDYEFKAVADAIRELSQAENGFDFEVEPDDDGKTLGTLHIHESQGDTLAHVVFGYGTGPSLSNCTAAQVTYLLPRNAVTVLGDEGTFQTVENADSITRYRRWEHQESYTDEVDADLLTDRANELVRANPVAVVSVTPELAEASCPAPWDDFWLGDTVTVHVNAGTLREVAQVRVNEIQLLVDDNGFETFEIERDDGEPKRGRVAGELF